ncbi:Pyruvate decarboxylase 2 [Marasmius sp. AFHP31]|nr:Pyruvate decarboxylase 2 [Marasmius sp. AFHP31]
MNIESLLNPAGERDLAITETTDQEIFEAVMRKKNGGDDKQEDADGEVDSPEVLIPSRREALQAVGILQQFLQVRDDDFSRRLEGLLSAFGRSTRLDAIRAATSTEITDYFSPIRK